VTFRATVLTLYPEMFPGALGLSLAGRALEAGTWSLEAVQISDFTTDRHRTVDDVAYGGRPGMVMMCEPIFNAMESLEAQGALMPSRRFVYLTPAGRVLDAQLAQELAGNEQLILLAGRYEGVDQRVIDAFAQEQVSIGDYVISGGELAAMVLMDAVARFIPGVVGDERSVQQDSFSAGLLDHPHYTRPADFRGMKVPDVLLSGNHAEIEKWRREQSEQLTKRNRPDLWRRRQADKGGLPDGHLPED